ncbi:unnamed protein product [Caenorhabditis sp. 36 PRJEB53466]|nr:unnamed protein product [Caenorhabditis sp. 36 PRJEB53466]
MAPRGRPRKSSHFSESSAADVEESSSSSSRPRRTRTPKRYFDEDYSPPPSKKRPSTTRRSPSEPADEEEDIQLSVSGILAKAQVTAAKSTPKPRGRPRKAPSATPSTRRKSKKYEEEVVYMDEDSEDAESSDDEFVMPPDEQEEIEEELNLSDLKVEKEDAESSFCPWLDVDPETLPKLELPDSSHDIPLPNNVTFDAIEVYEILRSYHRTLRLTPFTFEDFCAALISKNNSCIMAEIHIALLKICLKSDDEEQTHYSVTETNNAVNIMLHHLEALTYAEILRQYIEAYHPDESVREAINVDNYPYCGYEPKLVVLLFMCYRFLYSSEYKKVVNNIGKFQNDDNCRVCGKSSGRIVGCTQCEAAFHVDCSRLNPFPEVLVCNLCTHNNNVRGVANALPLGESVEREPLRSQPIGRDRYGRYYWFVARRLIVQSLDETEIHYYSTPPQLYQLLQKLDRDYYEKSLCEVIKERIDEFLEQMTLTVELSNERRDALIESAMKKNGMAFEYVESVTPILYLHKDNMKRMASILRDCAEKAAIKQEIKTEDDADDDDDATRSSGPLEIAKTEECVLSESMIGIFDGRLINTFWSGGATQEELVQYFLQKIGERIDPMALWRMGDEMNDQTFMQYYNFYARNEMSEGTAARKKLGDKKKYMASRFSMLDQFEWVVAKDRQFYGNSVLHTKFVSWTLSKIARKIPSDVMHRRWPEIAKTVDAEIVAADDYQKLVNCLLKLDAAMRKTIFVAQWWSGLGVTKMERNTVEQRETSMKEQQRIKKIENDALAKELDDSYASSTECGRGGMGGWAWVSGKYVEKRVAVPEPPKLPLAVTEQIVKTESSSNRKTRRLELLVSKIQKKRQVAVKPKSEPSVPNFQLISRCYSQTCFTRQNPLSHNPACYSPSCRYGYLATIRQKYEEEEAAKKGKFSSKNGKSIFVLQKKILRQMIVTAGCAQVYMPGFSPNSKGNHIVWPYPAPRPTFDLCWKWQTLNARSLAAVALQLKIMWSSIKWSEFDPDDTHPDRRVVIDTPSHDERRRIVRHKEMPPYGQYERYELEIEIIPLYEEHEEEEESWTSRRDRSGDCAQRTTARKKRPGLRGVDNRRATAIRKEWVDGVTLKVFEIKDYWRSVRTELERAAKRRQDALKKATKAREDAERLRLVALAPKPKPAPPSLQTNKTQTTERISVPYIPRRAEPLQPNARYLEMYNNSQLPPRTSASGGSSDGPSSAVPSSGQSVQRLYPAPIRHNPMIRNNPVFSSYQQQMGGRAAAGADFYNPQATVRSVVMAGQYGQTMRQTSNGYQFPEGSIRGGGRVVQSAHGLPRTRLQPTVVLKPFGEPITDMRRAMPVAEEAVAANAVGSDGDEQPPVIPRYDRSGSQQPQQQQMQQQPQQVRQVFNVAGASGQRRNVIFLKSSEGVQKMMVRPPGQPGVSSSSSPMIVDQQQQPQQVYRTATGQDFPPGTVLSSATRLVAVRPGQQPPPYRQIYPGTVPTGPRFVRVSSATGALRPQEQLLRRVLPTGGAPRQMEYADDQGAPPQLRYVLQTGQVAPKMPRVVPRGGMTMQMVQQQQHPAQCDQASSDNQPVVEEAVIPDTTGFAVSKEQEEH